MSETDNIYRKALMEEHAVLSCIIGECLEGKPRPIPARALTAEDLDRARADAADAASISGIGGERRSDLSLHCMQNAANKANRQEDQRVRRDTRIMRMNHKRLMLGCLQTLYWRKHDLEVSLNL